MNKSITIQTPVHKDIVTVWDSWNNPVHIPKWAFASDEWAAEPISNDLKDGGKFNTRMFAKDGSSSFNFTGTYTSVVPHEKIEYTLDDGRKVSVLFTPEEDKVHIEQTFEMENQNTEELQRGGWQAYLDNFKKHTESIS